jgi:leader peptidase (prepilin peptidase)/N-methyltransferase
MSASAQLGLELRHLTLVAALALLVSALAFASYAPRGATAVLAAFMAAVLVVLAATDLERRVIPNRLVLPAAALILCGQVALSPSRASEFVVAAIGAAAVLLLPSLINRSLIGVGDAKLAFLLGAGLGGSVIGALTLAFLATLPFSLAILIRGGIEARKATLPFGPFLALGALVFLIAPLFGGS